MKGNKIKQAESRTVKRSEINFASYNPRTISESARKKLKQNLQTIGLLGGVVWNERTGNIVSGHQKISIMDSVNRYDSVTSENDYEFRVEVVNLDERTEKEQNLFMNNRAVQGIYDDDMLRDLLQDIDYTKAGFDDTDMQLLGLSDFATETYFILEENLHDNATSQEDYPHKQNWSREQVIEKRPELATIDEESRNSAENTKINRDTNYYDDTEENQIARHNEIRKIKDRISNQNDYNKDGGLGSYVVISFRTPDEKMNFMESYGFDPTAKYINGAEFINKLEFGED